MPRELLEDLALYAAVWRLREALFGWPERDALPVEGSDIED